MAGRSRRPRREEVRERILAAAEEVFVERGFHAATVEHITDAAGFSRGAFYSNFSDKEELLLTILEAQAETQVAELTALRQQVETTEDFLELVRSDGPRHGDSSRSSFMLRMEFWLYAMRNPEAGERLAAHERAVHERFSQALAGHDTNLADLPTVAMLIMSLNDGLHLRELLAPDEFPSTIFVDTLSTLLYGVRALQSVYGTQDPLAVADIAPGLDERWPTPRSVGEVSDGTTPDTSGELG